MESGKECSRESGLGGRFAHINTFIWLKDPFLQEALMPLSEISLQGGGKVKGGGVVRSL